MVTEEMTGVLSGSETLEVFVDAHNILFGFKGAEAAAWLEMLFGYGLKPEAMTMGKGIGRMNNQERFIEQVVTQGRSCVCVFLSG